MEKKQLKIALGTGVHQISYAFVQHLAKVAPSNENRLFIPFLCTISVKDALMLCARAFKRIFIIQSKLGETSLESLAAIRTGIIAKCQQMWEKLSYRFVVVD